MIITGTHCAILMPVTSYSKCLFIHHINLSFEVHDIKFISTFSSLEIRMMN